MVSSFTVDAPLFFISYPPMPDIASFILSDKNTYGACGEKVEKILEENGIKYSKYVFCYDEIEFNPIDNEEVNRYIHNYFVSHKIDMGENVHHHIENHRRGGKPHHRDCPDHRQRQ